MTHLSGPLQLAFVFRGAVLPLALLPAIWTPVSGPPGLSARAFGACLMLSGLWLRLAAVRRIGGRVRVHRAGARELSTGGVYAALRNPVYLGNTLMFGGAVAILRSPLSSVLPILCLLALYTAAVLHEEANLREIMGRAYASYVHRTTRWMPRISRALRQVDGMNLQPWRRVLAIEARVVIAAIATPALAMVATGLTALEASAPVEVRSALTGGVLLSSLVLWTRIARRRRRKAYRGSGSVQRCAQTSPAAQGATRMLEHASGTAHL